MNNRTEALLIEALHGYETDDSTQHCLVILEEYASEIAKIIDADDRKVNISDLVAAMEQKAYFLLRQVFMTKESDRVQTLDSFVTEAIGSVADAIRKDDLLIVTKFGEVAISSNITDVVSVSSALTIPTLDIIITDDSVTYNGVIYPLSELDENEVFYLIGDVMVPVVNDNEDKDLYTLVHRAYKTRKDTIKGVVVYGSGVEKQQLYVVGEE